MVFRSIRWRLQVLHGLLLAVVLAGLAFAAWEIVAAGMMEGVDRDLFRLAAAINGAAGRPARPRSDDGKPHNPRNRVGLMTAQEIERGYYWAIWRRNGDPQMTKSANAPEVPMPDNTDAFRTRGELREAVIGANPGDFVVVGRSIAGERAELQGLAWKIGAAAAALWAVTMAAGWWLAGRALMPLDAISDAAERIARGDLTQRISTRDTETELGRVAMVLNSTFARLEAAFDRQTRFTADAAHELRTPVTVMLTHIQNMLAAKDLPEENRQALEACERAARRMRQLIESLLQLARFDNGAENSRRVPFDMAEIAREAVEQLRPLAAGRRVGLAGTFSPCPVLGDPDEIAQVMNNLLANAIQYNREGGEVRVSTSETNERCLCSVADTGAGIPTEHLPHLFERFYRVDEARATRSGRTGLGLAISRAIVQAHDGTISVSSLKGSGTTFIVSLPKCAQAPR